MKYESWRNNYADPEQAAQAAFSHLETLIETLHHIEDPVVFMEQETPKDHSFDPIAAISISSDPQYYKNIASKALQYYKDIASKALKEVNNSFSKEAVTEVFRLLVPLSVVPDYGKVTKRQGEKLYTVKRKISLHTKKSNSSREESIILAEPDKDMVFLVDDSGEIYKCSSDDLVLWSVPSAQLFDLVSNELKNEESLND